MSSFAHDHVVPYGDSDRPKKEQVAGMFDHISKRYDFLNRLLSGGTDMYWRRKAIGMIKKDKPGHILDIATGTGDMAMLAAQILAPCKVTGIDISEGMLDVARNKLANHPFRNHISLLKGDGEAINSPENSFDSVIVAFGVRNFENLRKGINEMTRVLKPGGRMVILEFSKPKNPFIALFYRFYMKGAAPLAGKLFSKNIKAYKYLDKSIRKFPEGEAFLEILRDSGLNNTEHKPLSFGICSIYCGIK